MLLQPIFIREQVIKSIREFFGERGFHEVVATVLNKSVPLEPNIYPFTTVWNKLKSSDKLYLSTSPEASLKKMIARGIGNCFAIGKTFRNLEGQGSHHNPEFLMLEWYRANANYTDIMRECEELIKYIINKVKVQSSKIKITINNLKLSNKLIYQKHKINLSTPWMKYSLIYLFQKYAKLDLRKIINDKNIITASQKRGYKVKNATWENLYNQIFLNEIEPRLPQDPFFLVDFPVRISPLCKPKKDNLIFAERFELYIGGMELGNGNTENTVYRSVNKVFQAESEKRKKAGEIYPPIDHEFLQALKWMKHSGKSYAGIGLGIDRLAMIMANVGDIREVEPFCIR